MPVAEAYHALTGIPAIGDKLATFYLRDVALVEGAEARIRHEDYPPNVLAGPLAHELEAC